MIRSLSSARLVVLGGMFSILSVKSALMAAELTHPEALHAMTKASMELLSQVS